MTATRPTIATLEARLVSLDARLAAVVPSDDTRELQRQRVDVTVELAWEVGLSDPSRMRALSVVAREHAEALGHDRGRALAIRNLGYLEMFGGALEPAFDHFLRARDMCAALGDDQGLADCEDLLSNIFLRLGVLDRALEHSTRSLALGEKLGDPRTIGWSHHNLGLVHERTGDAASAESEYRKAAEQFAAIDHRHGLARIEGLLARILAERGDPRAAEFYRRSIELWGDNTLGGYAHVGLARVLFERGGDSRGHDDVHLHLDRAREIAKALEAPDLKAMIDLLTARVLASGDDPRSHAEAERLLGGLLGVSARTASVFEIARVFDPEADALELLARLCSRRGEYRRASEYLWRRLEREQENKDEETRTRVRNLQISMGVAAAEREAEVSERLLLNTLPRPIVRELRLRGAVAPVHHEQVTVLFTDFVGFTRLAAQMDPGALVDKLDRLFTSFDAVVKRRGLEKLKTIGDAYMAAAGIPTPDAAHALNATLAALELREVVRADARDARGASWTVRVGLSSGPLVAGVIGRDKFAYDVWGDTVNTASRMESNGAPDRINISRSTHERIAPYFVCAPRGLVEVKNKGLVEMYFVECLAPEYAADERGLIANDRLLALLDEGSAG